MWVMDILCDISGIWVCASPHPILWIWNEAKDNLESKAYGTCLYYNHPKTSYIKLIASYLKYCSYVTYSLIVSTYILWSVNIFNILSCTSIKFNIFIMNGHDFKSYSIVFTYVNFRSGYLTLAYMFRCRLFTLLPEQNIRISTF